MDPALPDMRAMNTETDDLPLDFEAALLRCAQGDQYALRAIYERERRWLMATVLRIVRRRELAESFWMIVSRFQVPGGPPSSEPGTRA